MEVIKQLFEGIKPIIPMAVAIAISVLVIFGIRFLLDRRAAAAAGRSVRRQLITLLLALIGLIVVIIVSPLTDSQQGQLLSLIGILLTAAIALSSTTFVGNAMAGLMLRAVRSFRPGDFIRVGEHFGRVSERGLFHIEIQTEDRDLTTLPNLYLVTNPVKVIRSSGTMITAEVSLGYDIPRTRVRELLIEAAKDAELEEPFVHIMELGDFSITYRVAGLLSEVTHVLSTRSRLREMMLDHLHQAGIEIVSPSFMNTRAIPEKKTFIPRGAEILKPEKAPPEKAPEEIVFDKAIEAESMEKIRERFETLGNDIETLKGRVKQTEVESEREKLRDDLDKFEARRKRLAEYIEKLEKEQKQE